MADEIITNEAIEEGVDVQKYLDTINELKSNSVSRDDYLKLKNENKTLLNSIMTGSAAASTEAVVKPTAQELRNKLYGPDCEKLSDIEYVEAVCDLRDILLEEEGIDYMVPTGTQYSADNNDFAAANKVYNGFRHCLEVADGDNRRFHQELENITNETGLINKLRKRR